ncbi:MAG: putative sulfate/molybdate transporter [Candidatus Methanofastidiosum sp.]|nr:putative sulfate/molybdate transporter [Methanofastidiosum sp.]
MIIKGFEFNLRELAGSMGDFGTLLPLAIGYIVVNGLNPAGFLVMLGLVNIFLGLAYKLPMPLQPKKTVATVAIAQGWTPSLIYSTGFGLGIVWLFLYFTNLIQIIVKYTPKSVTRGIILALGFTLFLTGFEFFKTDIFIGVISILIILIFRKNTKLPAAILLFIFGFLLIIFKGQLTGIIDIGFTLPPITIISLEDMYTGMIMAGIAQIPLTLTNAVIAVTALLKEYFPEKPVPERKLLLNTGIINVIVPFFGGFPMCHGAGGLAGQYTFGARTGGANIMEGSIEISLGLFLSKSILNLFSVFSMSIVGAMLLYVSYELVKLVQDIKSNSEIFVMILTAIISVVSNMAIGFITGILVFNIIKKVNS